MKFNHYINGTWVKPHSGQYFSVRNPFNQHVLADVASGDKEDVNNAVDAARDAFNLWSIKLPSERAAILWKLAELVEKNTKKLATIESTNQGKTIKYARDSDLLFIIDNLRFFAGAARMLEGKSAAEYSGMGTSMIRREPLGVVAGIVPWNYPLLIAVWKLAPALAAGNSLVLKPASLTPLSLLEFVKLTEKAGIPKGVVNVVTGSGESVGGALALHRGVDMLSLTGDTTTGKKVMQLASSTVKKVHLELGGKAPMIVLPDADIEMAAQGAVVGGYWNGGQDCTAVTRVLVQKQMQASLVRAMVKRAKRFKLGNQLHEHTDMGPLVSAQHRARVEKHIQHAVNDGAKIACGGKRPAAKELQQGNFIEPTILTHVHQKMNVCREEIFGPVIAVQTYDSVQDALEQANDVDYGLAASVYGKNGRDCMDAARKLNFGTVWINEHGVLTSETPHGGFKQSGFGKDLSLYAMDEYTRLKHVYVDLTGLQRRSWHYTVYGKK